MMIFRVILRFLKKIYFDYKLFQAQELWRRNNKHNQTTIQNRCTTDNITVGKHTYGPLIIYRWGTPGESLKIGNFCSIASGVKFILGGNHDLDQLSSFPFRYCFGNEKIIATTKGAIVVEDDVWIGTDVTILSGVTIGIGSVLAAGSMVVKDVPPYSIIGGNPAKLIKKRFTEDIITNLQKFSYDELTVQMISENMEFLSKKINLENSAEILHWFANKEIMNK